MRFSIILMLLSVGIGHSASTGNPDEIRFDRTEGFGRTASRLIIRPDSLLLNKYTAHRRENGDTIGSFRPPSTRKRFDSLWALLEKGKSAKGIAPDSKAMVIKGRKNGKAIEFIVPVRPPIPEWARSFSNQVAELHLLAEQAPYSTIALKEKIGVKSGAGMIDSLWLENAGKSPFIRTGRCALAIEGAHLSLSKDMHGIKWATLADTTFPHGISVEQQKRMLIKLGLQFMGAGKWYFRARWGCEPDSKSEDESFREEVFSPLDSIDIGPG